MGSFLFRNYGFRNRRTVARMGIALFVALSAVLLGSLIHGLRSLS